MAEARTLLAEMVRDRDWDFPAFLRAYRSTARTLEACGEGFAYATVSERQFDRWCAGDAVPHRSSRRILTEMFGVDARSLVARSRGSYPPHYADRDEIDACQRSAVEHFDRGSSIIDEIEVIESTLGTLSRICASEPGTAVRDELSVQHRLIFGALARRLPTPQLQRLYRMAGVASGLLAKASHDMARPERALAHAHTVLACAEFAGCPSLRAWGYGLQSLVAYWKGNPQVAVHYATVGLRKCGRGVGSARSWLIGLDARARALLGDGERARADLELLGRRGSRPSTDWLDTMGGVLRFTEARELYYGAETEVLLHRGREAESRAIDAVAVFDGAVPAEWTFSDDAGARSVLALARLHRADVPGARAAAAPVLDLPPSHRVHGVLVSALRLVTHRSVSVDVSDDGTAFREELGAFIDGSAISAPQAGPRRQQS